MPKNGWLAQFADLRGGGEGLDKKEGVVFLRGVNIPMDTMLKIHKWCACFLLVWHKIP